MLWFTQLSQSKMSFILVHKLYMTVLADRWLAGDDFICDELIKHHKINRQPTGALRNESVDHCLTQQPAIPLCESFTAGILPVRGSLCIGI